jgi:hypothetical protein
MTTYSKSGYFGWAGGGKSGALVDMWLASRFATPPQENTAPPSGSPDGGPVTSGVQYGGPGAFTVTVSTLADYYLRVQYGGVAYWSECSAGSLVGGSTTWTTVSSFSNGWSNNGATPPTRWAIINNVVYVEVNITGGTLDAYAFTLPASCQPSVSIVVPIATGTSPFVSSALMAANGQFTPLNSGYTAVFTLFSYALG